MIVIRFGKWNHKATPMFVYDRVYRNGYEWTPLCIKQFRYVRMTCPKEFVKDIDVPNKNVCEMDEVSE